MFFFGAKTGTSSKMARPASLFYTAGSSPGVFGRFDPQSWVAGWSLVWRASMKDYSGQRCLRLSKKAFKGVFFFVLSLGQPKSS